MQCVDSGSAALRSGGTAQLKGIGVFAAATGRQCNERSAGVLNRTQYPSDVIALVVLWRLRYRLTLQDLGEMFLTRGIVFSQCGTILRSTSRFSGRASDGRTYLYSEPGPLRFLPRQRHHRAN
jgi:hypothetical protein